MSSMTSPSDKNVSVFCTYTSSYCGGAEPPKELLRELATPKALAETEVFIRTGHENDISVPIIASGKSDVNGLVQFALEPGDYVLMFADKKNDTVYNEILKKYSKKTEYTEPVDKECLLKWISIPELFLHVEALRINSFQLAIHKPCAWHSIPCVPYNGPLPP